jgi:hypothetical protein
LLLICWMTRKNFYCSSSELKLEENFETNQLLYLFAKKTRECDLFAAKANSYEHSYLAWIVFLFMCCSKINYLISIRNLLINCKRYSEEKEGKIFIESMSAPHAFFYKNRICFIVFLFIVKYLTQTCPLSSLSYV